MSTFPADAFKDLTDANAEYVKTFKYSELTGVAQRGLVNHWGYNTLAFNAANPRYATAAARSDPAAVNAELKRLNLPALDPKCAVVAGCTATP